MAAENGRMAGRLDIESPQVRQKLIMTLIQNTPAAYAVLSKDFKVVFLNDFFMRARNWEGPVPVGEICYNTINGGVICPQCAVREAMGTGRPARMLRKDVLMDGTATYSDDFAVPLVDPSTGDFDCLLQVIVSRTEEMRLRERNNDIFIEIIHSLVGLLEKKDPYICAHARNVSAISTKLAQHMGLSSQATFRAALGGMLHDLGMLYVPDKILGKNTRLDDDEYATIKAHSVFTKLLLTGMASFDPLRDIAIAHHERWDGTGYPNGASGERIPIEARVTAVADAYDAMTSDRPYRRALAHDAAMAEIKRLAGSQFDPSVVGLFVRMVEDGGLDREALVAAAGRPNAPKPEFTLYEHQRWIDGASRGRVDTRSMEDLMASGPFLESILDNTPAFYTIVDESFNVLFASDSLAAATGKSTEDLLSGKCFDIMGRGARCFQQDGSAPPCPAVRAFATGQRQYALMENDADGQKLYFDNFAVPIEMDGADGGKVKCCLEIMFDRTKEKNIQYAFEGDLRQLIAKVRDMIEDAMPGTSAAVPEAIPDASGFGEYLDSIKAGLAGLAPTTETRRH
jgi:PAS domain-containing protein